MKLTDIQLCKIQTELDNPEQEVRPEDCLEDSDFQWMIQYLELTTEFYWFRGHISSISTPLSDPDWSVNIKRGVLQHLEVNLEGNPDVGNKNRPRAAVQSESYSVMEQGIGGICESQYSVKRHVSEPELVNNQITPARDALNVSKVRNFEKCNDRPIRNHTAILNGLLCKDCSEDLEHVARLLTNLMQVEFNITGNRKLFLIDSVITRAKHVFDPLNDNRNQAVTFVRQTLIKREIRKIPAPGNPEFIPNLDQNDRKEQQQGLKYAFPVDTSKEVINKATHNAQCAPMGTAHGLHQQIEQLLDNIVNGIDVHISEESMDQLQLLIQKLKVLNRTELCHCMNHFGQDLVNDNEHNEKRRMILEDLLPYLGSLHSVEILYRRIESRRIEGHRARVLVEMLSLHPNPDDQILDTVLELCQSAAVVEDKQLKQACWLAFGSLVNRACKDEDRQKCPQQKEERYMRALIAGTKSEEKDERLMCYKALANAGGFFQNSSYNLLEDIQNTVKSDKEVDTPWIKAQAIYSIRRISSKKPLQTRAILLPILRNLAIHHEVRIAAFVVYMDSQPDHLSIQMLGHHLQQEKSRQVGNFIYSYLKGLAESKIPCKKNVTKGAQEALKIAKKWKDGLQYSKSYHWELELMKKKFSTALNVNRLGSPDSAYGLGGSAKFSSQILGNNFNWLELGYRSVHLEELVQKLRFKAMGVYPPINKQFKDQRNKLRGLTSREMLMGEQSRDLDALVKRMDTEVNVTERHPDSEDISASLYIKAFGQELQYWTLNKTDIETLLAGDSKALRDLEVHLSVHKKQMKLQKAFILGEGSLQVPLSIGIPAQLNLTNSGLLAMEFVGKAVMNPSMRDVLKRDEVKAKNVEISGHLNPRMALLTRGRLGVSLHHHFQAGIALEAVVNSSAIINGTVKLDVEKLKLESNLRAPQKDHTVVSVKSKPYTYSIIGPEMPKKYRPVASGKGMLHMMRMTPEQIKKASNQEKRRILQANKPIVMKKEIGNRTIKAELKSAITPASDWLELLNNPLVCLLAGPANASIELKPGMDRPEEIQVDALIADWMVTEQQYEDHMNRTSKRQRIKASDSSQSGSRSFTSAQTWKDIVMPGAFRDSQDLSLPARKPASLEETRSQEKFDFDALWTDEDLDTQPLTRLQNQQQQQQQPQDCGKQFIPLKRIYLNITAKGKVPQAELLAAVTLDTKDYNYKALTLDLISETKRTEEEIREEIEHLEEMERLLNDPLNTQNQERLQILMELDEVRQKKKQEERMVMCAQGEVEYPDVKYQVQSQDDVLPPVLNDNTKVKYRMGIQYGKTCENDKKVKILARAEKSKQQRIDEAKARAGEKSQDERQCEEDRRRGEKYSWTCKKVVEDRSTLKSLHVNVHAKVGRYLRDLKSLSGNFLLRIADRLGIVTQQNAINDQNRIAISIDQDRSRQKYNISVKAPLKNIKVQTSKLDETLKLPPFHSIMAPTSKLILDEVLTQAKPRCKITSLNKVITFDNVTYDYQLSKCHHILAKDCSPAEQFLVLGRNNGLGKDVIVHEAGHVIELKYDSVDGLKVIIDGVNQQMQPGDELVMREDGSIEKKNIRACERRTLLDVITPDIEADGITSSEVKHIFEHKSRHQTPLPPGKTTPRPLSHSASHGVNSASLSLGSVSLSLGGYTSEEVHMKRAEKETWQAMKEVMIMTFEGRDQREIMEMMGALDQLRDENGNLIDTVQPSSRRHLRIVRTSKSVTLYDSRLGLLVSTCGQNIKVEVARRFQDQVCGICGHFDGELTDELQGPSKEIYSNAKQSALTYQLQSIPEECAQECVPRSNILRQDRTLAGVDSSCYSKVLIPRCPNTCRVAETKRVKTDFVCLPRDSGLKLKLDDSIQRQRPHEVVRKLESKNADFLIRETEIHTRCQQ
ncbi:uncharacterized protein [Amphiura filiformis]|uniref:uncharacterized protein n=1 Tax=Amphiura filiformis TaxID=82378 RepID=UPI003B21D9BB